MKVTLPKSDDLLDELVFETKPDGARQKVIPPPDGAPVVDTIVRALVLDDVSMIVAATHDHTQKPLMQIRETHHALARCLARGMTHVQAASLTGYSPGTVARLINDPAFAELVSTYKDAVAQEFAEVVSRMRMLGLSSLDELQERLETDSKGWTKRELFELAKLCLVDGAKAVAAPQAAPGVAGATVNIKFVQAGETSPLIEVRSGGAATGEAMPQLENRP